jgi:hypothetical protein
MDFRGDTFTNHRIVKSEGGKKLVLAYDFDLATAVTGHLSRAPGFAHAESFSGQHDPLFNLALERVARARLLLPAEAINAQERNFLKLEGALRAAIARSALDDKGKKLYSDHLQAFFAALRSPLIDTVIADKRVRYFVDPQLKRDCQGEELTRGIPVRVIARKDGALKVRVLQNLACKDKEIWIPTKTKLRDGCARSLAAAP